MPSVFRVVAAFCLLSILPQAVAQSPVWGQCGGNGWTGATTCASGSVCTYSNPWYSQCLPGTAPSSTATTTTKTTSTTSSTTPTGTSNSKADYWFSFGDSYTQTGFSVTGAIPNDANPLGNPAYPGYTASSGANWLVAPYTSTVLSLTDQVNQFLNSVASKPAATPWTSANSLFSIWIGINDIGGSYSQSGDRGAFSDTLLAAEFALVQKLYNVGARNFLFVNVPPVDRSPLMLSQSASAQAAEKSVITGFNSRLQTKISQFAASNTDVKTFFYDSSAQFTTILNNPTAYGFKDATSYGDGSTIFWGNNYHPSTYAHKLFAQTVGQTVLGSTIW